MRLKKALLKRVIPAPTLPRFPIIVVFDLLPNKTSASKLTIADPSLSMKRASSLNMIGTESEYMVPIPAGVPAAVVYLIEFETNEQFLKSGLITTDPVTVL